MKKYVDAELKADSVFVNLQKFCELCHVVL